MKKIVLILSLMIWSLTATAAWIDNIPMTIKQPDGSKIDCLASGDEFFNRLHDAEGYTIIQNHKNGWYYYAAEQNGELIPSSQIVKQGSKAQLQQPNLTISEDKYLQLRNDFYGTKGYQSGKAPHEGILNNVVIYIRFSDQEEFSQPRTYFDAILNDTADGANSVYNYYKEVSYGKLNLTSTHYPPSAITTNISYQDTHPRSYYSPYDATTNPDGYIDDRTEREHTLLKNAIESVGPQIPSSLNIDGDNDGEVDNVTFIIRGATNAWASLLWPHRWSLWSEYAQINGKQVRDYIFMLSDASNYLNRKVFCHELFHALGAPDLYHYSNMTDNTMKPVSKWDIMESGSGHMGAYMKWRYAGQKWITEIPEISQPGRYKIKPLVSADSNAYKISSNNGNEFFVLENRRKEGAYEINLPGSGLLVYRINPSYQGNADGNDEVYIYRKNGTPTTSGYIDAANFPSGTGIDKIDDTTNPSALMTDQAYGGLKLSNITVNTDNSISFDLYGGLAIGDEITKNSQITISNYPNPFNNTTAVTFTLPAASDAELSIYNAAGQLVGNSRLGQRPAGINSVSFDGSKLNSGVYYYRLTAGKKSSATQKFVLLK